MAERTLPWWRKVLDYAISGIRSLLRAGRPNPGEPSESLEHKAAESRDENPEINEVTSKHASPGIEVVAPAAAEVVETAPVAEIAAQAVEPLTEALAVVDSSASIEAPAPVADEIPVVSEVPVADETVEQLREAEPVGEVVAARAEQMAEAEPAAELALDVAQPAPEPKAAIAEELLDEPEIEMSDVEAEAQPEPVIESVPAAVQEKIAAVDLLEEQRAEDDTQEVPADLTPTAEAEPESAPTSEPVADSRSELDAESEDQPMETTDEQVTGQIADRAISDALPVGPEAASFVEPANEIHEPREEAAEIMIAAPVDEIGAEAATNPVTEAEEQPVPAIEEQSVPEPAAEPVRAAMRAEPEAPKVETPRPAAAKTEAELKTAARVAAAVKAREESADPSPFSILVDQVYDGPLDLLLDLIRKQDIDIYDIPIAKITAQFLAYVNQLKAGDVDVAGEFIYTASLLIHIKSKMLLPRAPNGPDDAAEDPRRELVERLLEHERFKNAAQMLQQKQMLEAATWTNPGVREFRDDAGAEPEIAADTVDLVRVFQTILERARNRPILNVEEDSVTVGQMIQFLTRRLTMEDKPVALSKLLGNTRSERALIAMFLALLELVRLQAILLRQDRHFTDIFIKKNAGFEAVMEQGLASARDDWR